MRRIFNALFVLTFMIIALNCLTGCDTDSSYDFDDSLDEEEETINEDMEALNKNIVGRGAIMANGKFIVLLTNNNAIPVAITYNVEFYDEDENIIDTFDGNSDCVGANQTFLDELYDAPDTFAKYKIYVKTNSSIYMSYTDKVNITSNNDQSKINIHLSNPTSHHFRRIELAVLYYQGDNIVGYKIERSIELDAKATEDVISYYVSDKSYNHVKFDNYKVFVNKAYVYD